jgi:DNA-binding MarR family transcriptional regulator
MNTSDEARAFRAGLRALIRRFSVSERADVQCSGMTIAQAATLEALGDRPLRLGRLGRRLGVSPSTLTRNLRRLEERGWVERTADPEDARASRAALTASGRAAAAEVEQRELEFAAEILSHLDPEQRRALAGVFERLLLAVRRASERCCPGAFDHLMTEFPDGETIDA